MLINREELTGLVPHAHDMCLLDGVEYWDEERVVCSSETHLRDNNPLGNNGQLSMIHAIEYGAQGMAVHGGLLDRKDNAQIQSGYLVSVRDVNLVPAMLSDYKEALTIVAEKIFNQSGSMVYQFSVSCGDQLLATGRATVMRVEGDR